MPVTICCYTCSYVQQSHTARCPTAMARALPAIRMLQGNQAVQEHQLQSLPRRGKGTLLCSWRRGWRRLLGLLLLLFVWQRHSHAVLPWSRRVAASSRNVRLRRHARRWLRCDGLWCCGRWPGVAATPGPGLTKATSMQEQAKTSKQLRKVCCFSGKIACWYDLHAVTAMGQCRGCKGANNGP